MSRYLFSVIFSITLLFIGCKEKNGQSGNIIKPDKMQAILWDFFQADAYTQQYIKKDSLKNPLLENAQLQQKIFFLHGIAKEDFYTSYHYYTQHPDQMKTILDSVSVKAERKRNDIMSKKYSGNKSVRSVQ